MTLLKRLIILGFLTLLCSIPFFSTLLVTNIGVRFLVLSIIIVIFSLVLPGTLLLKKINFVTAHFLETVVVGTSLIIGVAILVHPIFGVLGISRFTFVLFVFIGIIYAVFNTSEFSILITKSRLRLFTLVSFGLIPFGIWVGRQANVVPINNFDKPVTE